MSGNRKDLSNWTEKSMRSFLWGNSGYSLSNAQNTHSENVEEGAENHQLDQEQLAVNRDQSHEDSSLELSSQKSSENMASNISSSDCVNEVRAISETDSYLNLPLKQFLSYWITNFNIPRYACNTLLRYINKNIDISIPKSYATLLGTPTNTNLVAVQPGLYHHIGFEEALKRSEINFVNLPDEANYTLDVNVDGLQVRKNIAIILSLC